MGAAKKIVDVVYAIARGRRAIRYLLTPIGFVVFLGIIVVFVALCPVLDAFLNFPHFLSRWSYLWISLPVVMCGTLLVMWSIFHFVKARGTPVPCNPPPTLVTAGPYKHARNPMLSGLFILLFGLGGLLRSVSLTFVFTPLFICLNILELKIIEEPELVRRLGDEYINYRKRTPMFVPWLGKKANGSGLQGKG